MIVINLFGAPGAGKSTGAAYIYSKLKMLGVNAELVTEFAKDKVWEQSKAVFENQIYIFGKQNFRLSRLKDKVDVAITDSPLLLSGFYGQNDESLGDEFDILVAKIFNSYPSINLFIDRVKPYNPAGRFQNECESNLIHEQLLEYLNNHNIYCEHYNGDFKGYDAIIEKIHKYLKENKVC